MNDPFARGLAGGEGHPWVVAVDHPWAGRQSCRQDCGDCDVVCCRDAVARIRRQTNPVAVCCYGDVTCRLHGCANDGETSGDVGHHFLGGVEVRVAEQAEVRAVLVLSLPSSLPQASLSLCLKLCIFLHTVHSRGVSRIP